MTLNDSWKKCFMFPIHKFLKGPKNVKHVAFDLFRCKASIFLYGLPGFAVFDPLLEG